jgi:pyridinium-3,5-biscarboxylic acid mononucleotide sulfurtransferase
MNKQKQLDLLLKSYKRVLIAYSGGVDSTFLLAYAIKTLGKGNVLAVTAVSETYPKSELKSARSLAAKLGAKHVIIKTQELKNIKFRSNPFNRCYHCKDELFRKLSALAKKNRMVLCDATNYSDLADFRPGRIAATKWKVKSPLLSAGITKGEIRKFSRAIKLPNWNYPAQACLASRLPYGTEISAKVLNRIEKGEAFLKNKGFKVFRVRHHGDIARIEIGKNEIKKLFSVNTGALASFFKKLGWRYVTVDLEGYRTGSLNP